MKTLLILDTHTGTAWLETDSGFATIYDHEPEAVAEVSKLDVGKVLYFSVPRSKRVIDGRKQIRVRRLAWPASRFPKPSDVVAPILALAIFLAGLVMVAR